MCDFDRNKFSFPESRLKEIPKNEKPPKHSPGEKFLKGPIPLDWLLIASKLPGRTFQVAIALWFLAGVKCNRTVNLTSRLVKQFGVGRSVKARSLSALEDAGLITVERRRGKNPVVTILEAG